MANLFNVGLVILIVGVLKASHAQVPGPRGYRGEEGMKGIKGKYGFTGILGQRGETGERGDDAPAPRIPSDLVGPQGQTGEKGEPGVYVICNNNTDDEPGCVFPDETVTAVEGVRGLRGLLGATGATGPTGRKGNMGSTGYIGKTGVRGEQGDVGPPGASAFFLHDDMNDYIDEISKTPEVTMRFLLLCDAAAIVLVLIKVTMVTVVAYYVCLKREKKSIAGLKRELEVIKLMTNADVGNDDEE